MKVRGTDPASLRDTLLENELVTSVQLKTELADAMVRYFRAFDSVVASFVGLGGLLAFFFLLSVLGFLLLEREGEYATLRTMGYGTKEIALTVLTEVIALAVLGLVVSLAAWAAIAFFLQALVGYAWFSTPVDFRFVDIAIVAGPTILFLVLSALPGIRGLMRLQLASVLRARAMG
jgi:putative ABC transport system permease protein